MANADGGVYVGAHQSVAQKRWKNAYLTLKRLLVFEYRNIFEWFSFLSFQKKLSHMH
jgi:hypothetical protein